MGENPDLNAMKIFKEYFNVKRDGNVPAGAVSVLFPTVQEQKRYSSGYLLYEVLIQIGFENLGSLNRIHEGSNELS